LHGPVRVPETVGIGTAKVVVSFADWKEGQVASSEAQLPVVAAPTWIKWQAESPRLLRTLMHPEQAGLLQGLLFSPDGRRLVAGHVKGMIQVWDTASGRQLMVIDDRRPSAPNEYHSFATSPDWQEVYVGYSSRKLYRVPTEKKTFWHFESKGEVRAWDVETGQPRRLFAAAPSRGILSMNLSPDGSTLLTFERPSGEYEIPPKVLPTLWDARTGKRRASLPESSNDSVASSPDGKTLVLVTIDAAAETTSLLFCDMASGKMRRSVVLSKKGSVIHELAYTPDGKFVIGSVRYRKTNDFGLAFWDAATGQELGFLEVAKQHVIESLVCSGDGRRLAASTVPFNREGAGKLYLIDLASRKIVKEFTPEDDSLPEKGRIQVSTPAFCPDGKWLAVASQAIPTRHSLYSRVDVLGQPHIHLIETATGEVREMLASPPGYAQSLCFSPDGKTLASSGDGRVLLWDMTAPPGERK
jgi:WD40 repeat protein